MSERWDASAELWDPVESWEEESDETGFPLRRHQATLVERWARAGAEASWRGQETRLCLGGQKEASC